MEYKQIIADSWKYTQENKKIVYWLGFFPSILTTCVGVGMVAYQIFAFKKSYLFDNSEISFMHEVINFGWEFISGHASLTIPLIIVSVIVFLLWTYAPTFAEAAAVQALARAKNGQKSGLGIGIKHGLLRSLPLFEWHVMLKTISPIAMATEAAFVIRNLNVEVFKLLVIPFAVATLIGLFLKLLFTYTDMYIVIDDEGIFSSLKKSIKLVILSWQETLLITILMIIIGVRVVIQAVLVFLIPAILLLLGGYIASLALNIAILIVFGVVGLGAIILAAYLGGVIDIFAYAVWTFTFLDLTSKGEVSARAKGPDTAPDIKIETPIASASSLPSAPPDTVHPTHPARPIHQTHQPHSIPTRSDSEDKIPGLL